MKIKGYLRLLVPVLLFAGVQMFAQPAMDGSMTAANPSSHKAMAPDGDLVLISDRTFITKSIEAIATDPSLESAEPGCSSSTLSGVTKASFRCIPPECAAPPQGCFYQGPPATNAQGCPINCGHLVCDGLGN